MDITMWQVIASAFGGAAFGAFITGGVSIYSNKVNYKRDYYKKILDKRIKAYEKLEQILLNMCELETIIIGSGQQEYFMYCLKKEEYFNKILVQIKEVHELIPWFTNSVKRKYLEYAQILFLINSYIIDERLGKYGFKLWLDSLNNSKISIQDIENKFKTLNDHKKNLSEDVLNLYEKEYDFKILAVGIILNKILLKKNNDLLLEINNDFIKLYEIDKFFKDKINQKKQIKSLKNLIKNIKAKIKSLIKNIKAKIYKYKI